MGERHYRIVLTSGVSSMSTTTVSVVPRDLIEAVADEMAAGIQSAVQYWMEHVQLALEDSQLSAVGRLEAIRGVLNCYNSEMRRN